MIRDPECPLPVFSAEQLENKIMEYITGIYKNTDEYIERHKEEHKQVDTSYYNKRLQSLDKQIKRLLDLYQFEEIEAAEIRKRIEDIQQEKNKIIQVKKQIVQYDYEGFKDLVQTMGNDWDDLSIDEKREYLMNIIDRIELDANGYIKIIIKVNEAI